MNFSKKQIKIICIAIAVCMIVPILIGVIGIIAGI